MGTIQLDKGDLEDLIHEYYGDGKIVWQRGRRIKLVQPRSNAARPIGFYVVGDDVPEPSTSVEVDDGGDNRRRNRSGSGRRKREPRP